MNCDCCNKPGTTSLKPTRETCNCVFVKEGNTIQCVGHDEAWIKTYNEIIVAEGLKPMDSKELKKIAKICNGEAVSFDE